MKNECKKGVTNSTPCCQACTVGCVVFPWVSPRGAVVRRAPRVFLSKDHWTSGYRAAPSLPMIHTGYFLNCSFHYSSVGIHQGTAWKERSVRGDWGRVPWVARCLHENGRLCTTESTSVQLCAQKIEKKKEAMKSLPEQWQLLFGSQRGS